MDQVHRRFSAEQIAFLLQKCSQDLMTRVEVQELLGIGDSNSVILDLEHRRG